MKAFQSRRRVPAADCWWFGVVLVLVLGAIFFYWRSTFTEDTDDAQVDGNLYQVSSRITGHVVNVYVDDNQTVQTGQLLVEIDPTDYQVALDQAEADLANAQAQYVQASTNVPITSTNVLTNVSTSGSDVKGSSDTVAQDEKQVEAAMARVAQAQANQQKAQDDVDRYTPLVQKDVIRSSNSIRRCRHWPRQRPQWWRPRPMCSERRTPSRMRGNGWRSRRPSRSSR